MDMKVFVLVGDGETRRLFSVQWAYSCSSSFVGESRKLSALYEYINLKAVVFVYPQL